MSMILVWQGAAAAASNTHTTLVRCSTCSCVLFLCLLGMPPAAGSEAPLDSIFVWAFGRVLPASEDDCT